jgi:membrane protease YdiL (CAAX protease family)
MVVHPRGVWLDVFSLGLLLGYLYHYTRNLWVPIGIHMAHNALAFVVYTNS